MCVCVHQRSGLRWVCVLTSWDYIVALCPYACVCVWVTSETLINEHVSRPSVRDYVVCSVFVYAYELCVCVWWSHSCLLWAQAWRWRFEFGWQHTGGFPELSSHLWSPVNIQDKCEGPPDENTLTGGWEKDTVHFFFAFLSLFFSCMSCNKQFLY